MPNSQEQALKYQAMKAYFAALNNLLKQYEASEIAELAIRAKNLEALLDSTYQAKDSEGLLVIRQSVEHLANDSIRFLKKIEKPDYFDLRRVRFRG
jgi:hypothetical protein